MTCNYIYLFHKWHSLTSFPEASNTTQYFPHRNTFLKNIRWTFCFLFLPPFRFYGLELKSQHLKIKCGLEMIIGKYEFIIPLWQPQVKSTKCVLSMFDIKKYFPDDLEIMDFLQKQFHYKWMYTYKYAGIIPQTVSGSVPKEFVYKYLLKLEMCVCVCVLCMHTHALMHTETERETTCTVSQSRE